METRKSSTVSSADFSYFSIASTETGDGKDGGQPGKTIFSR